MLPPEDRAFLTGPTSGVNLRPSPRTSHGARRRREVPAGTVVPESEPDRMGSSRLISAVVWTALAFVLSGGWIAALPARAQEAEEASPEDPSENRPAPQGGATLGQFPPGVEVVGALDGSVRMGADGAVVIEGPVSVTHKGARFQADRMTFRDEHWLEAVGNVLVVWQTNRITGSSMLYDLNTGEGTILDAMGQVDPEYQFVADEVRKVGDNLIYLKKAQITTCTQPTPYWSFRVSSARIRVDGYARMWNARFRYGRVPFLYFPFLFWPIKDGRAPGLLLPEIGTTQSRGQVFDLPLYLPLGRSADVTLTASYYTIAGTGFGADFRAVPNDKGRLDVQAYWIDDQVSGTDRWRFRYEQNQTFRNGFRMVADVDSVSDFDYYADFEKDFAQTSKPNIRGLIEFSRNGRWISMNARELRNEQLFSDGTSLIQQTLPELEWRGRSRKLGRSPVYLSFESSFASIRQQGTQSGTDIDADYLRGDLFPTLSIPWSPLPWLDINPSASYRYTYYTQSRELVEQPDGSVSTRTIDEDLARGLGTFGVEFVGPRLFRIFERQREDGKRSMWKHVVEPTAAYRYAEGFDRRDDVVRYDEIDSYGAAGNAISYGLRSRLLAKRPRTEASPGDGNAVVMPGSGAPPQRDGDPFGDQTVEAGLVEEGAAVQETTGAPREEVLEPVEIASASLTQIRSFDRDLSSGDLDGNGISESSSRYSELVLTGRYNPLARVSFDVRAGWQPVYRNLTGITLSGSVADLWGQVRFSAVFRNGLGFVPQTTTDDNGDPLTVYVPRSDDTQLNMFTAFNIWGGKIRLGLEGTYDFNPSEGQSNFPNKLWTAQYSTQCCTFLLQRLQREYSTVQNRDEWTFRVGLRGIGKILDQSFGGDK